jgi:hypothetical protein
LVKPRGKMADDEEESNWFCLLNRTSRLVPTLVSAAGQRAAKRFMEFFTAQIRNRNTRDAYLANRVPLPAIQHIRTRQPQSCATRLSEKHEAGQTTIRWASALGFGCTRKAADFMRFRPATRRKSFWTPTCGLPNLAAKGLSRSFARRWGDPVNCQCRR